MSTTRTWHGALRDLLTSGRPVSPLSPGAEWRGSANRELVGYQTVIPMRKPVILAPARKLGFKFLAAEAAWICSGDNKVSTIAPFAKAIASMSDDGQRFFGAYGPKFIEQLSFAVEALLKDPASRQAVISIWREQPRQTKDTPCTLSWQFLLRDGRLDCVATMRSSDIWMGWVYDVFNFSMVSAVVALELRNRVRAVHGEASAEHIALRGLQLGDLYLTAGSQHLYERDVDGAQACLEAGDQHEIAALDLGDFIDAEDLIEHLWACAGDRSRAEIHSSFLAELYR